MLAPLAVVVITDYGHALVLIVDTLEFFSKNATFTSISIKATVILNYLASMVPCMQ